MSETDGFHIVGIGASAGGLDAIQQLFDHLECDTGSAFIIIQHLSPDFKSLMPELLAKHTEMQIFTAEDKQEIKPNCIYLNQRNKNLHIKGNRLYLLDKGPKHNLNLPIDIFFHTLGEEYRERSTGVILSGTGSDGSRGIKTIKEAGGTVIVQDPDSAQFDGMPNSAISSNIADFILPPGDIGRILKKVKGERPRLHVSDAKGNSGTHDVIFNQVLEEIHKVTDLDFRQYKRNTLLRRLEKRMDIKEQNSLFDYLIYLKTHPQEVQALKQDFLIGVTSFFRDGEAFEIIKTKVIPELVVGRDKNDVIRIWVAGCSTGEEVYSLAMLVDSYIRQHNLNVDYKLFATDVDSVALNKASRGVFNINITNEIAKEYFDKYFIKRGDQLEIIKRIRDRIVFSKHNLSKDPPFIHIDLVTCRNLLIYLDNKLQEKVFQDFQFSLNHHGYLFLGSSESLGVSEKYFEVLDSKWKIYRNTSTSKSVPRRMHDTRESGGVSYKMPESQPSMMPYRQRENPDQLFYKYLSKRFSPSSVFIDKNFNILFIRGDAGRMLEHGEGSFKNNLLEMVSPELATVIRSGIRKVEKGKVDVRIDKIITNKHGSKVSLDMTFSKLGADSGMAGAYLIHFGDETEVGGDLTVIENIALDDVSRQRLEDVEDELKSTKMELQNVVEELETSNEELQSSNEELMASNEELQSTNEELQSVNEELYTVNTELQEKNRELVELNNDINNLFESTEIGTLFLDRQLRIRKFTKQLTHHFSLTADDVGRPIHGFSTSFGEDTKNTILNHSQATLDTLKTFEVEITDLAGKSFLCRISPFVTVDKMIDGVVFTFVDVSELKLKEVALKESHEQLTKAQEISRLGSWTLHAESGEVIWSEQLYQMFGLQPDTKPPSVREQERYFSPESWERLNKTLAHTMTTGEPYEIELKLNQDSGNVAWIWARGEAVKNTSGDIVQLRGVAQDITKRVLLREELLSQKRFCEQIAEMSPIGIYVVDVATHSYEYMNDQYCNILGMTADEVYQLGHQGVLAKIHADDTDGYREDHADSVASGKRFQCDFRLTRSDGQDVWCHVLERSFEYDDQGKVTRLIGGVEDVTLKKKADSALAQSVEDSRLANLYKDQFLANMSHEIRTPLNGIVGFSNLLREDSLEAADKQDYIDTIEGCSNQLLNLVDDILDLSKIAAGQMNIDIKPCDICRLITDEARTFNKLKEQKGKSHIEIKENLADGLKGVMVMTDGLRLQQVLTNLLSNALKFSDDGTIEVGCQRDGGELEFYVKDEGIGISGERIDKVFERFEHLEGVGKKYEGTGLGLALSKGIIELLGGQISLESQFGKGSVFKFRIPFKAADAASTAVDPVEEYREISLKGMKLLVAEDEQVNQMYYKCLFKDLGVEFLMAANGQEAIDMYRANSDIDVVLMDIRMPTMSGDVAAQEILSFDKDAVIIAQTAYAMSGDRDKYLKIGFKDYLSKPVNVTVLKEVLCKYVRQAMR